MPPGYPTTASAPQTHHLANECGPFQHRIASVIDTSLEAEWCVIDGPLSSIAIFTL
jgi:hypothetical protein